MTPKSQVHIAAPSKASSFQEKLLGYSQGFQLFPCPLIAPSASSTCHRSSYWGPDPANTCTHLTASFHISPLGLKTSWSSLASDFIHQRCKVRLYKKQSPFCGNFHALEISLAREVPSASSLLEQVIFSFNFGRSTPITFYQMANFTMVVTLLWPAGGCCFWLQASTKLVA